MRIAVLSDTHGHVQYTRSALQLLRQHAPEVVLHCGDIGSCELIELFSSWPTHFVFGNVDHYHAAYLERAIRDAGQTCHGRFGELELARARIALLHSDDELLFHEVTHGDRYDLVCYGHTHVARQERIGRTLVLNPGAVFRASPHSLAIVELPDCLAQIVPIET